MCGYKTLHNNEDGYVVACNCCKHIQVAFGTTAMSFTKEQFYSHIYSVNELKKLLKLMIKGRNTLEHEKLFEFHEN